MSSTGITHFDVIKISEAHTDSDVAETYLEWSLDATDKKKICFKQIILHFDLSVVCLTNLNRW